MYSVFKVVNWLRVKNNADMRLNPNVEEFEKATNKCEKTMFGITSLQYFAYALIIIVTGLIIIWIVRKNIK